MLKIVIIVVVIYLIVVLRANIRLPHPGMQAGVDVLRAAYLKDQDVELMATEYVRYSDAQNSVAESDDPYALRLHQLTRRYVSIGGIKLNFKAYKTSQVNAFATADGSVRVFSGLMDRLSDDELMAIIGHEIGHIRNKDSASTMRKAYLTSAARNALGAMGGSIGSLSGSQLGAMAEKLTSARFSQQQENAADDFSFGFLLRNGYDPYAMSTALTKITALSASKAGEADSVQQLFSTHPNSRERAARMRNKADLYTRRKAALKAGA